MTFVDQANLLLIDFLQIDTMLDNENLSESISQSCGEASLASKKKKNVNHINVIDLQLEVFSLLKIMIMGVPSEKRQFILKIFFKRTTKNK